jgi:YegS/Rv2252/BmrU family lipid kinase
MSAPQVKVIINPVAGASSTRRKWPRISRLLKHIGLSFDYQYTEGVGHAIELARAAVSDGYRYLVAVGGDGTVNEVANGILHSADASSMALGVISTGTGSDFARSMGLPRHYVNACSSLIHGQKLLIDVGLVEFQHKGQVQQRYFVNAAGVGFDAAVVESTERLRTLIGYRNKSVVVRVGDKVEKTRVVTVAVANGNYLGGGMYVAPDAKLNDYLFDVMIVKDMGKFELLRAFPRVYKGTHVTHPKVVMGKAAEITVESPDRILVHADGELLGEGPVSFRLIPAALSIMV